MHPGQVMGTPIFDLNFRLKLMPPGLVQFYPLMIDKQMAKRYNKQVIVTKK